MQKCILQHFSSMDHNDILIDASVTFIDKTDPKNLFKHENFWRKALKTMTSYEINSEERWLL